MPIISVIIPTYNSAKFIDAALESVFLQTFKDFEIIVVDDGSTDNTKELLKQYFKRIHYFYQQNKGPSAARNLGISKANGKLLAFLDADDLWLPEKLEKQVAVYNQKSNIGLVGCGYYVFNDSSNMHIEVKGAVYHDKADILRDFKMRSVPTGSASGVLIPAECFKKVGCFDESLRAAEDRDMWFRIIKEFDFEILHEPLVKIRKHDSNSSRIQIKMVQDCQKKFIKKHLQNELWIVRQKAISHSNLDAAHEYYDNGQQLLSFWKVVLSILTYPPKLYKEDDKYYMAVKLLIPKAILNLIK